ncbi:MAG TPA: biosynthetic arginine decarboxylase [Phycisphaerae bacterium]|nr:biosynthetic arginine decarboxylase [Phycisphaerae bacterium]
MANLTKMAPSRTDLLHKWSVEDSLDLYNVRQWGSGFFSVNERGHVTVSSRGSEGPTVDLKELVDELQQRGIEMPMLLRFSDILRARIQQLCEAFQKAFAENNYTGSYMGVYPIKVNQQRHIVEEVVQYGAPYNYGLEAGSKPELLAVLALLEAPEPLVICNGYKDNEYIDMALWATKLGRTIVLVVEEFGELQRILDRASILKVQPKIGFRMKLAARGSGRWQESGGSRSKFGLTVTEMLRGVELLRSEGMLDSLVLTHFHIGSQITNIRSIKEALAEGTRIYLELTKLGAGLRYFDVGGGMAVDYDGSSSNFASSANYTMAEYVSDVVSAISEACNNAEVPHPTIVTECGRAITAHHSVLIFNVLGVTELAENAVPPSLPEDAHQVLHNLLEMHNSISVKNFQEAYHDALHLRDETLSLFKLGYVSLADCATMETVFWSACRKIQRIMREKEYVPDELQGLEAQLADTYVCNFSAFQSVPDCWAVGQLFPIMPIHRLNEEPTRRAILADITCDSDGKIDKFIDLRDIKSTIELHSFTGESYYVGIFMTGAYQEILGDMHNLFGDTNAVHVTIGADGQYFVEHVVDGDSVEEVLSYVQYSAEHLVARLRRTVEDAVRRKQITFHESAEFLRRYERGLKGYTYLEG